MKWDRDRLLMELTPFEFGRSSEGPEVERYKSFYEFGFIEELGARHHLGWLETGEFRVVLQSFEPDGDAKGTVFVFHGYFDHAGIYRHLVEFLLREKFCVVIYDMPGHGLSSGKPTAISSFEEYQVAMTCVLELCEGNLPKPFHAVGQSTGGAVLLDRLSHSDSKLKSYDKVVLLAPLVRPKGWTGIKLLHSLVKPFFGFWRRSFSVNSEDSDFMEFLKKVDPLQSKHLSVDWISALKQWVVDIEQREPIPRKVLIIQGTEDHTVEWAHNNKIIRRLCGATKTCYIDGAHHHVVNESKALREKAFACIKNELG